MCDIGVCCNFLGITPLAIQVGKMEATVIRTPVGGLGVSTLGRSSWAVCFAVEEKTGRFFFCRFFFGEGVCFHVFLGGGNSNIF